MTHPRIVATIEARMTSRRLPGKVLMPAGGRPLLQVLLDRLNQVPALSEIVIATTGNASDDAIASLGLSAGVQVFRGSESDVLGRVRGALDAVDADICVEITGDCPLVDPLIVGEAIAAFLATRDRHPYVSNSDPYRSVPAGLDVQVFDAAALRKLDSETSDPLDREHVSYGFYRPEACGRWNPRFITHASCAGAENLLITLDYPADYSLISRLHEEVSTTSPDYGAAEIVAWVRAHPELHDACRQARMSEAGL